MSTTTKVLIGFILFFITLIVISVGIFFNAKFTAEKFEASLTANDQQMQNVNGIMHNKLAMSGFTVQNYGKTFIDAIEANAKRYEGDKAGMMKWVQETSTSMPTDVHKKFMDVIDSSYSEFEASQAQKISVAQEYTKFLNASFSGMIAKFAGYPSEKAKKIMDLVISSSATKKAWATGVDDPVDPFAPQNTK
jgi:hypothetical protein